MVVHTAAHAALHQRSNSWLLGAGVEEILGLIVAVHRASGQAVLRGRRGEETWCRRNNNRQRSPSRHVERFAGD